MISFALVNVFFAWTSHVFSSFSPPLANFLTREITAQDNFLWGFVDTLYGVRTLIVADIEVLSMLVILITVAFLFNLQNGRKRALLLSIHLMSLCFIILGIEILAFDSSEFNLHVTQVQAFFGLATWFTNADLFYAGLGVFVASACLLYSARLQRLVRAPENRALVPSSSR